MIGSSSSNNKQLIIKEIWELYETASSVALEQLREFGGVPAVGHLWPLRLLNIC